jgi:hypothetical protein
MKTNWNDPNTSILDTASLLPCPFCGDDPKISKTVLDHYIISCINMDCPIVVETDLSHNLERIIKEWNTRGGM